jgi:hypothetical protein
VYKIQSWAFATFSPFRYSLFRYFITSFRYRYSATFLNIAIRYSLFAIATFVKISIADRIIMKSSIAGRGTYPEPDAEPYPEPELNHIQIRI